MVTGGYEKQIAAQPLLAQASNYITQAIEAQQYIVSKMFNEQIGLQSTFNMKRERQTANETQLDEDPLRPLIDAMLEERQRGWERVNKKYGTDVEVKFKGVWSKYNATMLDGDGMPIADQNATPIDLSQEDGVSEPLDESTVETNEPVNEPAEPVVEAVAEVIETVKEIIDDVKDEYDPFETDDKEDDNEDKGNA